MGHDISGYNKEGKKIAYLRYGAFSPREHDIYKALDCKRYDNGWSGSGKDADFSKEQLTIGLQYCKVNDGLERETEFLTNCLNNMGESETVTIEFG